MKITRSERDGVTVFHVDPGNSVLCDDCGRDYTDLPDRGGILFQSKAICPLCEPKWLHDAAMFQEENYIRGRCPADLSFADWVRGLR